MNVYKKEYLLGEERLSTGELFRLLQDIATLHCNQIGLGMDVIGPKGLIWVVVRQYVKIRRYPRPGERTVLSTWPGSVRHAMFPRHYMLRSADGELLLTGNALWAMVDFGTRKMVNPAEYGFNMEGLVTGDEEKLVFRLPKIEIGQRAEFTVPEAYLDTNRHMNNTRYYDMAEHCLGGETEGLWLREAMTEFISEARLGEKIDVSWGREGDRFYICGDEEKPIFRMSLEYGRQRQS